MSTENFLSAASQIAPRRYRRVDARSSSASVIPDTPPRVAPHAVSFCGISSGK
jgi:hypothetical protein